MIPPLKRMAKVSGRKREETSLSSPPPPPPPNKTHKKTHTHTSKNPAISAEPLNFSLRLANRVDSPGALGSRFLIGRHTERPFPLHSPGILSDSHTTPASASPSSPLHSRSLVAWQALSPSTERGKEGRNKEGKKESKALEMNGVLVSRTPG